MDVLRLSEAVRGDWVKLKSLHPEDTDFIYEIKISNFNKAQFSNDEKKLRRSMLTHVENFLTGYGPHAATVIGRWRFTREELQPGEFTNVIGYFFFYFIIP